MATLPPPPAGYSIVPNDLPPPPAGYAPVDDQQPAAQPSALSYYMTGKGQTPGTENLPSWMQSVHNAIDPIKILQGLPGVASMALPAGEGPVVAPTAKALHDAGAAAYEQVRGSGVGLDASKMGTFSSGLQSGLRRQGFYPVNSSAPATHAILDDLRDASGPFYTNGKFTAGDYLAARQALQKQAQNFAAPKEQGAASIAIDRLDNLFDKTAASNFSGGTPQEVANVRQLIKDGRANFAAGYRSDLLTGKQYKAELQTAATNSGMNLDNKLRQATAGVLTSPKSAQGYSPAEIAQMEDIVKGSVPANAARFAGNLMGGGGGLGAVVSGGLSGAGAALAGRPLTGAALSVGVPAPGYALKTVENALTRGAMNKLAQTVRMRSPLAAATPPMTYSPAALRAKALLALPTVFNQGNQ